MRVREDAIVPTDRARLMVLASGSSGNCTVLTCGPQATDGFLLIDLGLSPRRTRNLVREAGLEWSELRGALVTHLDWDHLHTGWLNPNAEHPVIHLHRSHYSQAVDRGLDRSRLHRFERAFSPADGVRVEPILNSHDESGTAAFRIELERGVLGFATDLGHVTDGLIDHLRGVDVLAIESNYCPRMQLESDRPWFLKQRIMGGAGHLSNQQSAEAVRQIAPRQHVLFLHLSRQCNRPELVAALHEGADYAWTITRHDEPSRWVSIGHDPIVSARQARRSLHA